MHFKKFLVWIFSNQGKQVLVYPLIQDINQHNQILGNGLGINEEMIKVIMNKEQVGNNNTIMIKICTFRLLY